MEQSFFIVLLLLVLLDGVLIVCFILLWRRRSILPAGSHELREDLRQLINDMNGMSSKLATNLEERMAIVQRISAHLDEKIREAEEMAEKLREVKEKEAVSSAAKLLPQKNSEGEQVLLLAKKGLHAEAIARRLQKPLGEVELILNLKKLSLENR